LIYFLKNNSALENVSFKDKKYLDEALSEKKGVILLTAHFGNFPLLSLKLAKEGYIVNFVTRPMRDKNVGDYLYKLRTKAGVKTIFSYPRRQCVFEIIKALRNNEIVIMQMDQNFGTGGVWVKFFGKLAATPTGPVTLAIHTSSVIVPAYIYRESFGRHIIKFFPKQSLLIKENKHETVILNIARFTKMIESWISEYPEQWGWIHRRWKSRPSKTIEQLKFKIEQ
ncbi:MAG: lysophospholipid acyltransferase family protein, partial [Candidatus Omnitrophica bacterium]|nr:lysophospholipid acyltransferase family protein [Candidatus Omnitrophota bacterium]